MWEWKTIWWDISYFRTCCEKLNCSHILRGICDICEKEKYSQFDSYFCGDPLLTFMSFYEYNKLCPRPPKLSDNFKHVSSSLILKEQWLCADLNWGHSWCLTASDPLCWFIGFQLLPGDMLARGFRFDHCDPNVTPHVFIFGKSLLTITFCCCCCCFEMKSCWPWGFFSLSELPD